MSNQLIVLMKIIYSGALCQTAETERILMEEVGSAEPSTHNAEEEEDEEEVEDAGMTHYKNVHVIIALHWCWIHIKSITVGELCIVLWQILTLTEMIIIILAYTKSTESSGCGEGHVFSCAMKNNSVVARNEAFDSMTLFICCLFSI